MDGYPNREECQIRHWADACKFLDTVISIINYVDVARVVNSDAIRVNELAFVGTSTTPFGYECAVAVKFLYAIISRVSYVYVS